MEVYGKSMVAGPANVIFLSSFLGREGPNHVHKCDWKCENEHVCANMYRCKLTGLTHICDKNCDQRILYDNHSSLCRASGKIFLLTPAEEQAVRGIRRKLDTETSPPDSCGFKRRRGDANFHPSPFERSFSAVSPICSQAIVLCSETARKGTPRKWKESLLEESIPRLRRYQNQKGHLAAERSSKQCAGTPPLPTTGFRLDSGLGVRIPASPGWSGRIWARTGCTFDESGNGTCQTGDCGGRLACNGLGAVPPASLFEVTLGKDGGLDFYDVSIVDGYNLPLVAAPQGVDGVCNATGCASDINMGCPKELQVVSLSLNREQQGSEGVIACKSACEAFGLDQYCCSGEFANPTTCRPSFYSAIFKRACPTAYSYAFDDSTSIFTCNAADDYDIVFCPDASRVNGTNGAYNTGPEIQEQDSKNNGKVLDMAFSSADGLRPFSIEIVLVLGFLISIKVLVQS